VPFVFPANESELNDQNKKEHEHNEKSLAFLKNLMSFVGNSGNQSLLKSDCYLSDEIEKAIHYVNDETLAIANCGLQSDQPDCGLQAYTKNIPESEKNIFLESLHNLDFNTKSFYTSYINSLKNENVSAENIETKINNMLAVEANSSIYKLDTLVPKISLATKTLLAERIQRIKDLLLKSYLCLIKK